MKSDSGLGLLAVEGEMLKEAAGALGLAGKRLELALTNLKTLESQRAATATPPAALDAKLAAATDEVSRRLWMLLVQRESMGLRHHGEVYLSYDLPPGLVPKLR